MIQKLSRAYQPKESWEAIKRKKGLNSPFHKRLQNILIMYKVRIIKASMRRKYMSLTYKRRLKHLQI